MALFDEPARYPLEITSPRSGLPAGHRITRQHPSVPYNFRVTTVHGTLPQTCTLTANVPPGMVIDAQTCVVSWDTPAAGTHPDITVEVCDAETCDTETWTLVVGTSGHVFIDAVAGNDATGSGTFAAPWASLDKAYESAGAGAVLWIKGPGTYRLDGLPQDNGDDNPMEWRVRWNVDTVPTIFIGYGSSKPTIDFEHDGSYCGVLTPPTCSTLTRETARFQLVGPTVWVDNLVTQSSFIMAFQVGDDAGSNGWTVRRTDFNDCGPGFDGSNGACVMSEATQGTPRYGSYFGENTLDNIVYPASLPKQGPDFYKLYSEEYMLIADNVADSGTAYMADGLIAIKGGTQRHIDVRANDFTSLGGSIGGNQAGATDLDIRFNLIRVSGTDPDTAAPPNAIFTNQGPGSASNVHFYRNTTIGGRILVRDSATAVGPYAFTRNVIVNEDGSQAIPHICDGPPDAAGWADCGGLSDIGTIVDTDNLKGNAAAGIVSSSGILEGENMTSYGPTTATPRGHQYAQ